MLYAIAMLIDEKTYYAHEYTSNGKKAFDSDPSLTAAKFWKSSTGAEKALRKLRREQDYLWQKYTSIQVVAIEEEEVEQDAAARVEDKINRKLEHLSKFKHRDVHSAYEYSRALLLLRLKADDSVYLYERGALGNAPTTVTVDAIDGIEFIIGTRQFDRISGQEVGGLGIVLPNDLEICRYFALYQVAKLTRWEDYNLEVLAKVVEALGVSIHE